MSKDEALRMALEFIEKVNKDGWILADFESQMYAVITAIREALAQPEQDWEAVAADQSLTIALMKSEMKPVAWIYQNAYTENEYLVWNRSKGGRNWRRLYAVPLDRQPLIDDEVME